MKTLLYKGKVYIGKNSFTEAVGFDNETGRITFAGTNHEAEKVKTGYQELIDVKNKLVLPSFTDGHCHLVKGSLVNKELNLRTAVTAKEFKKR